MSFTLYGMAASLLCSWGGWGVRGRLAFINVGVHSACTCILTLLGARQDGEFSQQEGEETLCDNEQRSRGEDSTTPGDFFFFLHFKDLYSFYNVRLIKLTQLDPPVGGFERRAETRNAIRAELG